MWLPGNDIILTLLVDIFEKFMKFVWEGCRDASLVTTSTLVWNSGLLDIVVDGQFDGIKLVVMIVVLYVVFGVMLLGNGKVTRCTGSTSTRSRGFATRHDNVLLVFTFRVGNDNIDSAVDILGRGEVGSGHL
jgi:hypothetical protein